MERSTARKRDKVFINLKKAGELLDNINTKTKVVSPAEMDDIKTIKLLINKLIKEKNKCISY